MTQNLKKNPNEKQTEDLVEVIARQGVRDLNTPVATHRLASIETITDDNSIMIRLDDELVEALAICPLSDEQIGADCLVLMDANLPHPIIMGVIQPANHYPQHLDLYAEELITLNCGDSFIEMNEQGHVNIQGRSINNQAYGPNRIKGASVKIN